MEKLVIMRHSYAVGWGPNDYERQLTPEGVAAAQEAAGILQRHRFMPDLILSSSAKRAAATAGIVARILPVPEERLVLDRELYLTDGDGLLRILRALPEEYRSVLLVGHNPAVSELGWRLSGRREALAPAGLIFCDRGV